MQSILIDRPQHKFSAAHMTVFPDGRKERLHGHNYQVATQIFLRDGGLAGLCDFAVVKAGLVVICKQLNERTLLPLHNPYLNITTEQLLGRRHVRVEHREGIYLLPEADVALLPLDNITVERLAAYCQTGLADYLQQQLAPPVQATLTAIEVCVYELPGQGASYRAAFPMDADRV